MNDREAAEAALSRIMGEPVQLAEASPEEPCRWIPDDLPCPVEVWPLIQPERQSFLQRAFDPSPRDDYLAAVGLCPLRVIMRAGLTESAWRSFMRLARKVTRFHARVWKHEAQGGGRIGNWRCPLCGKQQRVLGALERHLMGNCEKWPRGSVVARLIGCAGSEDFEAFKAKYPSGSELWYGARSRKGG